MRAYRKKKYSSLSEQLLESGGCKAYYGHFKTMEEAEQEFPKMLLPDGKIYHTLQDLQDTVGSLKRYKIDAYPAQNLDGGYCIILSAVELIHKPVDEVKKSEGPSLSDEERKIIMENAKNLRARFANELNNETSIKKGGM